MATWPLQEAKAKFSELVDTAEKKGPQIITRRGVETAVLCPIDEWKRIYRSTPVQAPRKVLTNQEFLQLLRSAPDFEIPDRHMERLAARRRRRA